MKSEIINYGKIHLLDVIADEPCVVDTFGATHVRFFLPADEKFVSEMQEQGYILADRTLGVSINLRRSSIDFAKNIRMKVEESGEHRKDILRIAKESFVYDRRFHILPKCNSKTAELVLKDWVANLNNVLVSLYKENMVGFLALEETDADTLFVHLAAVEERYRLAGAALSLYSRAAQKAKDNGYKKLDGRISTQNTAVMNLYTYLGAVFLKPIDIYLKEL